jgi:predicted ATP-dependent endonuclease of OLD family
MIHAILNREGSNQDIVEQEILEAMNRIISPDVHIQRIQSKSDKTGTKWEIYFKEEGKELIPLSQSGSGLKTVLAVLVFIHALPKMVRNLEEGNVIYAFEELENNLHPSVQRRLYDYIEEKSKEYKFSYFITTHSTVAVDFYYGMDEASIFQVSKIGGGSTVRELSARDDVSKLIDDLGQRASDLLQSNCIIWVEGPTDRIYLNKWIELQSGAEIKENKHYTIMFYGGRLLSHLSFDAGMEEAELISFISMFTINRHSIVVIDSDKSSKSKSINNTKKRIQTEISTNDGLCWITKGREIENYIAPGVFVRAGLTKDSNEFDDQYIKVFDTINASPGKKNHSNSKVEFARKLTALTEIDDLDRLDLRKKVEEIIKYIKKWN